jgi:hypothetical protein
LYHKTQTALKRYLAGTLQAIKPTILIKNEHKLFDNFKLSPQALG